MPKTDRVTLKSYFETNDRPTQSQFIDLIDSSIDISASGQPALQSTASLQAGTNIALTQTGSVIKIAVSGSSGTAFPGAPATEDTFWRTDINLACFYDGTRWLTVNETAFTHDHGAIQETADGQFAGRDLRTDYAPYFTRVIVTTYVVTTNNGTKYWTLALVGSDATYSANTTIYTFNTSADAADTYVTHEAAPSTPNPANRAHIMTTFVKTSTPGNLLWWATLYYRLIVT